MCSMQWLALALRSAHVETYFFVYVAVLSAVGFLASVALPDLSKHGYLDGNGDVEKNIGFQR